MCVPCSPTLLNYRRVKCSIAMVWCSKFEVMDSHGALHITCDSKKVINVRNIHCGSWYMFKSMSLQLVIIRSEQYLILSFKK
jgi:hypothetical protein